MPLHHAAPTRAIAASPAALGQPGVAPAKAAGARATGAKATQAFASILHRAQRAPSHASTPDPRAPILSNARADGPPSSKPGAANTPAGTGVGGRHQAARHSSALAPSPPVEPNLPPTALMATATGTVAPQAASSPSVRLKTDGSAAANTPATTGATNVQDIAPPAPVSPGEPVQGGQTLGANDVLHLPPGAESPPSAPASLAAAPTLDATQASEAANPAAARQAEDGGATSPAEPSPRQAPTAASQAPARQAAAARPLHASASIQAGPAPAHALSLSVPAPAEAGRGAAGPIATVTLPSGSSAETPQPDAVSQADAGSQAAPPAGSAVGPAGHTAQEKGAGPHAAASLRAQPEAIAPPASPAAVNSPGAPDATAQPDPATPAVTGAGRAAAPEAATAQAQSPGPPAAQLAQGLAALHISGAGARQVTIHLTPGTLGSVQVHIARGQDGAASITLQVEKPETLRALQQDSAHLHQALDRAGLPSAGRQISYELAQAQIGAGAGGGSANLGGNGNASDNQHGHRAPSSPARAQAGHTPATHDQPPPTTRRAAQAARSGINITA